MLRTLLVIATILGTINTAGAAEPNFYVSIRNSLRFFANSDEQRHHLRDYCLYMRCAGPHDNDSGLEPEKICKNFIRIAKVANHGDACLPNRFKKISSVNYWEPSLQGSPSSYETIWDSASYSHNLDTARYSTHKRKVEFEIQNSEPGDACTYTLKQTQQVLWTERPINCKSSILKDVDISTTPYVLEGTITRSGTTSPIKPVEFVVRQLTVMAIGDSIAAGEGLPHLFYKDERKFWLFGNHVPGAWLERRCHRSFFNYSLMAMSIAAEAERTLSIDYFNYACSGARILMSADQRTARADESKANPCKTGDGGLLDPYAGFYCQSKMQTLQRKFPNGSFDGNMTKAWLPAQVEDAKATLAALQSLDPVREPGIDFLVVSIGGNDVLFGKLLVEGLLKSDCKSTWLSWAANKIGMGSGNQCVRDIAVQRQDELPGELEKLERSVLALKPRVVMLVGYLDPTHDAKGQTCDDKSNVLQDRILGPGWLSRLGGSISAKVAEDAYAKVLHPLNTLIEAYAKRPRAEGQPTWVYVDPNSTSNSAKRGWCATPSWFTTYADSTARQGDQGGTAHPNLYGQNSLNYTIRCHMAQLHFLDPLNVCKSTECNCKADAPRTIVK